MSRRAVIIGGAGEAMTMACHRSHRVDVRRRAAMTSTLPVT